MRLQKGRQRKLWRSLDFEVQKGIWLYNMGHRVSSRYFCTEPYNFCL